MSSSDVYTVEKIRELSSHLPQSNAVLADLLDLLRHQNLQENLALEILRLLRNSAAKETSREFMLQDCQTLLSTFCFLGEKFDAQKIHILWQFYFNLSNGQPEFQNLAWSNNDFEKIYWRALTSNDRSDSLTEVLLGVFYSRLQNDVDAFRRRSNDERKILVELMLTALLKDSQFALLCIQRLLETDSGVMKSYSDLNPNAKGILRDVIRERDNRIHDEIILECSAIFKENSKKILTTTGGLSHEIDDPREVHAVLTILGAVSSYDGHQHQVLLQNDRSLLIDCVYLLRMIHDLGKSEIPNKWTPARRLSDMNNEDFAKNPIFGFKRDLIRLIANLSHGCKENQDLVRDIEGIQLLLDCATADGKNPFITQWVVLGIRNLCVGNVDNQNVLRRIEAQGKVDKELLAQIGVDLQ